MTRTFAGRIPPQQDRLTSVIAHGGIPRIAAEVIARPRLIDSLDRLLPLTVLRAPYGFGKTTLVAQWAASAAASSIAWVSVERPGTTAAQFWSRVADALDTDPALPRQDGLRLALAGPGRPLILVVDDLDRVVDPEVAEDLLGFLRRYPRLHLVVTTRAEVLDPRTWLDLDGQVLWPDDLGFTPEETVAVLGSFGVPAADLDVINANLGGWPIAVRAYGLARGRGRGGSSREEALATVQAQLASAVLGAFDDATFDELILPTTVIGDFTEAELGTLLDRAEPARDIGHLVGLGLLTTDAGSTSQRYRWPGFVRDAVIDDVTRTNPTRLREIRRALAPRYVLLDQDGIAMRLAAAAEDWVWLRQHLEARWTFAFMRHYELLGELITTCPPGALGDSPQIQSLHAIYSADVFRIESLRSRLPDGPDEIQEFIEGANPLTLYDRVLAVVSTLRLLGELDGAMEAAAKIPAIVQAVYAAHPDDLVAPGAAAALQCGLVWVHAGQIRRAIGEFERSHHYGPRSHIGHILRDSASKLALVHGFLGEHPLSRTWVSRAEAAPNPETWVSTFLASSLNTGKLYNAIAVLDRRAATDLATELEILHPREELWVLIRYARSKVALFWGHPAAAARELDAAEAISAPSPSPYLADLLLAARVDLAMKRGLGSRCSALLDQSARTTPVLQVRRARLSLLAGDAPSAVELARAAVDHPDASPATDLEALVIEALARHRLGDLVAATRLSEAMAVAGRRIDAFALVPRGELIEAARDVPGAIALLEDPRLTSVGDVFPDRLEIILLTERERVVLGHLSQGLTLQAIAVRETVSINTVKSQVRSLYSKLGATDREQAMQIATTEGLI
ncbi:MAG: putative LuxR family transcriptional regulator [Marmoricola sp.]|nr:putative LuxR family transcriptional regulator [Marmoricola sp.]